MIGEPLARVEDLPLLSGTGRFAADISLTGQAHMRVVRSPVPHGLLRAVDARRALGDVELPVRPEAALRVAEAATRGSTSKPGGA